MNMTKIVSQLDADGYFIGSVVADQSPLEPDVFLIPGSAVDAIPPSVPVGMRARWNGSDFEFLPVESQSPEPKPEPEPDVPAQRRAEILTRLVMIDTESIRPAREITAAIAAGQPAPEFAASKLTALEAEAAALRAELRDLPA
ncbi:hypothetical protein [Rhodocyclus gracilis]|uniref:hypothetical protein n=1 Tax=Rhodocyclus gracilis TaxID=2929842 RepID=UPI00188EF129|nr:hypothetical protein [Rhodocyclus gracilis]